MYEEVYRVLKTAPDNDWYDWRGEFDGFPEEDKKYFAQCVAFWKDKSDKEKCEMLILLMNRRGEDMCWEPAEK